jgi:phenylacetate-CoA ligase
MGRVLFTTLENRLMPLVRYEIGDYAYAAGGRCACARTLPLIGKVLGRGMNLFRLPGGRLLSPWKLVEPLRDLPTVRKSQIVQHGFDNYTVRYVSDAPPDATAEAAVKSQIMTELGPDATVVFERVADIARTARGKYMSAVSEIAGST